MKGERPLGEACLQLEGRAGRVGGGGRGGGREQEGRGERDAREGGGAMEKLEGWQHGLLPAGWVAEREGGHAAPYKHLLACWWVGYGERRRVGTIYAI